MFFQLNKKGIIHVETNCPPSFLDLKHWYSCVFELRSPPSNSNAPGPLWSRCPPRIFCHGPRIALSLRQGGPCGEGDYLSWAPLSLSLFRPIFWLAYFFGGECSSRRRQSRFPDDFSRGMEYFRWCCCSLRWKSVLFCGVVVWVVSLLILLYCKKLTIVVACYCKIVLILFNRLLERVCIML